MAAFLNTEHKSVKWEIENNNEHQPPTQPPPTPPTEAKFKDGQNWVTAKNDTICVSLSTGANPSGAIDDVKIKITTLGQNPQTYEDEFTIFKLDLGSQGLDLTKATAHKRDKLAGTLSEANEESTGAFIHINCDDDDANNARDFNDGNVVGEDDLLTLSLTFSPLPNTGKVTLARSTGGIYIWTTDHKGAGNGVLTGNYEAETEGNGIKTWDLSLAGQRTEFQNYINNHLYLEGRTTSEPSLLTLTFLPPNSGSAFADKVKYRPFGAITGSLPTAEQQGRLNTWFPEIVDCEWSVLAGASPVYNCIAWSVDRDNVWYNPVDVDMIAGNGTPPLTMAELDNFYDMRGFDFLGTAQSNLAQADAIYYNGYHACRRTECSGMDLVKVDLPMFSSKLGSAERIEHVWNQLHSHGPAPVQEYGDPARYYKKR